MRVDVRLRSVATLLLLGLVSPAVVTAAETSLTLEDAILRALDKNDRIIVEREGLAAARAAVNGARGIYDPVLQLESGWSRVSEPVNSSFSGAPPGKNAPTFQGVDFAASATQLLPTGGQLSLRANGARQTSDGNFALLSPAYSTRLGLELRQPLLVLLPGSTRTPGSTIRIAALDRDRAEESLRREVTDTVAAVEGAYWTLGAARREVAVREESVGLAEEQLSETGIRVDQGVAAESERAQPRAELERRRGEALAAREALARAENAMKLLILADTDTELWLAPLVTADAAEVEAAAVDPGGWMEKALATRPEIRAAEAAVEQRKLERSLAREGTRPSLDAVASYDRFGLAGARNPAAAPAPGVPQQDLGDLEGGWGRSFGTLNDAGFSSARVGLVFQVPVGNRAAKARAAIAESAWRQAEAQLAFTRKTIRAEVLDASAALQTTDQRIAAARAAREAAEVQFSAERERFAVGLSTNFLVLTRQNDLSRARLDEIAAVYDHRRARTSVARATGALLEERRIDVLAKDAVSETRER